METNALTLSPLVHAYALESGIDIIRDTTAGAWGYYIATVPTYAPGATVRVEGPLDPITIPVNVAYSAIRGHNVTGIVARFPAGTPYAYTL